MLIKKEKCNEITIMLNSFALSIIINAQYIAYIANVYFGFSGGLVTMLYILALALVLFSTFFNDFKLTYNVSKTSLLLVGYTLIAFVFSFLATSGDNTLDYFTDFIATGIITLAIVQATNDCEYILRFNMAFSILFCFQPSTYVSAALMNISYDRASMFASYILVPVILSGLYHFLFYRKTKPLYIILYLASLFTFIRTFSILGRGPLLSILVGVVMAVLVKNKEKWGTSSTRLKFFIIVLVIGILLVVSNIQAILIALNSILQNQGIQIAAITKSINLLSSEGSVGLLNNRNDRWSWALSMFSESPLFGNGIGSYADMYGTWPHNIVLQLLVEVGVIGAFPLLFAMFHIIYNIIFKDMEYDDLIIVAFLCGISIPRLMLSSYLWHHPEFWLFMYFGLISINRSRCNVATTNRDGGCNEYRNTNLT